MKTALLLGATGLVGSHVLEQLYVDDRYDSVVVFSRKSLKNRHPKLIEHLVDFNDFKAWQKHLMGEDLFSCLGTTMKNAGSKEAQYLVDYTYPYNIAKRAKLNGVMNYALISSVGANENSKVFYTKMKGELDRDISSLFFKRTIIVRPSFIDGERNEKRLGEQLGLKIMRALKFIPFISKYRPMPAGDIAHCMIEAMNDKKISGKKIFTLNEIDETYD